ncbi:COP9 signalosome complex subunit 4-like [Rhopalosiphum maidis]|uniref:COP9 signalosome complex subunit 4-like n=1 Tax=Rhopalosiphum maidis TaxID=43146 RepID=UPI000F00A864|nr:COP9 signalosome complex subunit 4-like [Rhopalosiphum maidis]
MNSVDQVRYDMKQIFELWPSDIQRITKCRILLNSVISTWSTNMVEMLKAIVEFLAKNNVTLFVSRQMFSDLCMKVLPWLPNEQSKLLAHFMRDKMQPREVDFEYHMSIVCHHLSYIYEKEGNWKEAAYLLASIPVESYYRFSIDYELDLYMKIARLFMEAGDPWMAEPFVKKASLTQNLTSNKGLHLSFKVCLARMMDFRFKFIEAAQQYYELSHCLLFKENERLTSLKNTIVCTILSVTGDIRMQLLKSLFKDERSKIFIKLSILEKLRMVRLIKPCEIDHIDTLLLPHQKMKTSYGTSILTEAIAENNIQAIKKIYKNIGIESLGHLLKMEPEIAKLIVGRMISEKRIEALIDHTYGFIRFKSIATMPNELEYSHMKFEPVNIHLNRMSELIPADESKQNTKNGHTDK